MHRSLSIANLLTTAVVALIPLTGSGRSGEITAFTEPYRDIDVAASEIGTLLRLDVQEGDAVVAGQRLATLDDHVLQASLKMAEAAMQSVGRMKSARAELRLHADRLEKLMALRERNHASQQEVDRAQSQKEIADANWEATRDDLRIKAIEHERIEAQLRSRQVISPIDGIVSAIYKDVGEFVSSNDPMVMKIVQLDVLLVVFSAPMSARHAIHKGDELAVIVEDEQYQVMGQVEYISPTIDAQSGTVRVKLRLPNSDGRITSGAPCRVRLPGTPHDSNSSGESSRLTSVQPNASDSGRSRRQP